MIVSEEATQVLSQVRSQLESSGIDRGDEDLFAFQLMVWCHLSRELQLEVSDRVESALVFGTTGVRDALARLARHEGKVGLGFADAPRYARSADNFIVSAVHAAKRLVDGGIFDRFSAGEIASTLDQTRNGTTSVPNWLAQLMVDLTAASGQSRVYCPWDSATQFLNALFESPAEIYIESKGSTTLAALVALVRPGLTDIVITDPLTAPSAIKAGHLETFGASLSIPPMGMLVKDNIAQEDLYGRFPVPRTSGIGLMVQHILAQSSGLAAIVVTNGFVFGPGRDRELREFLLKNGQVVAAIALPSGVFDMTSIPTTLLVFDKSQTHSVVGFLDASSPYFGSEQSRRKVVLKKTKEIVDFCMALVRQDLDLASKLLKSTQAVVVSTDAVLSNDASLQVDRYVLSDQQRALQTRLQGMRTIALGDIVEFHQPVLNKDRNIDVGTAVQVLEVGAADLPAAGYITSPDKSLTVVFRGRRSGSPEDAYLSKSDIVLITKGSVGKVGIVSPDVPMPGEGGWIAGQSAIVLRSANTLVGPSDLRGLGLWLRSAMGQQVLRGLVSGAAIPMISLQALRQLQVPEAVIEATPHAIEVLDREAAIQKKIDELRIEQSQIAEAFWTDLKIS